MIDFMKEMLRTPDAQSDPYSWSSTLLAHAFIGVALAAVMPWWLAVAGYAAWEAAQLVWFQAGAMDCLLDWVAVCLGVAIVVMLQTNGDAFAAILALAAVLAAGVLRRG